MIKNIASLTVAYNEEDLIGGCLDLLDVAYKLVLMPTKTFSGKDIRKRDNTEKIAKEKGATVIFTDIRMEPDVRNFGLKYLRDLGYEYAFIVDADEYWPKATQIEMARIISERPEEAYKAYLDSFFKSPNWKMDKPNIMRRAIVATKTDQRFYTGAPLKLPRKFLGKRLTIVKSVKIYHFSYVRSPEKMKEKIASFSHAAQVTENWYEDVFVPFTLDNQNLPAMKQARLPPCVAVELPEEISSKIPEHLWPKTIIPENLAKPIIK